MSSRDTMRHTDRSRQGEITSDVCARLLTDYGLRRELRCTLPVATETFAVFTPPRAFGYCPRGRQWSNFLTLLRSVLGLCDATPGLLVMLEDRSFLNVELAAYLANLDAVKRLEDYTTIVGAIEEKLKQSGRKAHHLMFRVDVDEVEDHMLILGYLGEAETHRVRLRREIEDRPGREIVLVTGTNVSSLLRRFSHYRRDMIRLTKALRELA